MNHLCQKVGTYRGRLTFNSNWHTESNQAVSQLTTYTLNHKQSPHEQMQLNVSQAKHGIHSSYWLAFYTEISFKTTVRLCRKHLFLRHGKYIRSHEDINLNSGSNRVNLASRESTQVPSGPPHLQKRSKTCWQHVLYKLQTINNIVGEYPGVTVSTEFLSRIQKTSSSKLSRETDFSIKKCCDFFP